jgi:multidrug efflux pump subunit AcrA (membrane-fusion protein)
MLALSLAIGFASLVQAASTGSPGKKPDKASATPSKGATYKVERTPFKVDLELKGTFEAEEMKEIFLSPRAWIAGIMPNAPITVVKAVEHGTMVKRGDVLVELDLDKIDLAIKDLKTDMALTQAAIQQSEEELPILEKELPLELAAAERAKKVADEDLERFRKVGRALSEETAKYSLEGAIYSLESAREELKQLERMYRSKDLTEETEEFILKRQRFAVRMADFQLKSSRIETDHTLKVDLPRKEKSLRESAAKLEVALEKARTLPLTLNHRRLALQKMKYDHAKSSERLAHLEKDREAMTVRAPADGIVYYGKCLHGQWSTDSGAKLQRGGSLSPDEVFMTLVKPRPLFIRAAVEEKDLHLLHVDLKGTAKAVGYSEVKLPAQIVRLCAIPQTPGKFEARLAVQLGQGIDAIMPGTACTVKFVPYKKVDAITVPASAVFTDEIDEDSHYVYLAAKGGKAEKRPVKVGKTTGGKTEILDGLKIADEIFTSKPENK